jgi:hypothetical protein
MDTVSQARHRGVRPNHGRRDADQEAIENWSCGRAKPINGGRIG